VKLARARLAEEMVRRLDGGTSMDDVARQVAALLIDSGKTSELNSLLRDVQELRAQNSGVVEVTADSAYPLTSEQRTEIEQAARAQYPNTKQVIIHHRRNPDVIGGITLSFANARLDLTIRDKLNQLRTLTA